MMIPTGSSHATLGSSDISELERLTKVKEEQIDYIIKNRRDGLGNTQVDKHKKNKRPILLQQILSKSYQPSGTSRQE